MLLCVLPQEPSTPPDMCIAVSWRSSGVAKLTAIFEIATCLISYFVLSAGASSSMLNLFASGMALFGSCLLLSRQSRMRTMAAFLCLSAALVHVGWSIFAEGSRSRWQLGMRNACASGLPSLVNASELQELLLLSITRVDVTRVIELTVAGVQGQMDSRAKMMKEGIQPIGGFRPLQARS